MFAAHLEARAIGKLDGAEGESAAHSGFNGQIGKAPVELSFEADPAVLDGKTEPK